jgi:UDP-2,3-diacylglucosamine pyrophosphatase LpxH
MTTRVRSLFLSDVHLGNPGCQAGLLLDFLATHAAERIYLVGDIVDFEYLDRRPWWHPAHTAVLRRLLAATRRGIEVTWIPGNHDHRLRRLCGRTLGGFRFERFHVHATAGGERFLLLHGDEFDGMLRHGRRLAGLGAFAYRNVIRLNTGVNRLGRRLGFGYAPLATTLKHRVGSARDYMDRFRDTVAATAAGLGVAGVICGHIHRPEDRTVGSVRYLNTGDWVENCSGIIEDHRGELRLVRWATGRAAGHDVTLPVPARAAA